jgi:hypothetical protein
MKYKSFVREITSSEMLFVSDYRSWATKLGTSRVLVLSVCHVQLLRTVPHSDFGSLFFGSGEFHSAARCDCLVSRFRSESSVSFFLFPSRVWIRVTLAVYMDDC